MFEQSLLGRSQSPGRTALVAVVSFALDCLIVLVLVLIPLLHVQALPLEELRTVLLVAPPPPPPPPPPTPAAARTPRVQVRPRPVQLDKLIAPSVIPKTIAMITDKPAPPLPPPPGVTGGVPGGVPGGVLSGVIGGIVASVANKAVAPPPPPPAPKPAAAVIRVNSGVQQAKLISQPLPEYPPAARAINLQGVVRLEAIIGKDGMVKELRVVSGPEMLAKAALDAVAQWRYRPTVMNDQPVEVSTVIDVTFLLK